MKCKMLIILKIIIGIAVSVAGAKLRLRRLLFMTVAAVAGFTSIVLVQHFYRDLTRLFEGFTYHWSAAVMSIIVMIMPAFIIYYFGWRALEKLFTEQFADSVSDQIMGAAYATLIYSIVIYILGR